MIRRSPSRFPRETLAEIDKTKYLYLRAGESHRFIAVWAVVVEGRVLVRSWNDNPDGWYRAFLREKRGAIRFKDGEVDVRGVRVRGMRFIAAAEDAYRRKYTSKPNQVFVVGFAAPERRAASLELRPG